jgi:hypothetical protein
MVATGLEVSDLVQKATLWPKSTASAGIFGNPRIGPRVEIDCKWQFKALLSSAANSLALSVVGTVWVDRAIPIESILRRGTVAEPLEPTLYVVVAYSEIPDINCWEFRRSVMVSLWNDTLPEGV